MGSTTHITGEIRIDPPITWVLVKDSEFVRETSDWTYTNDLRLRIVEESVETDEGTLTRRTADAVVEGGDERRAYDVVDELQRIVDQYGEGRTFTGRLDLTCRDYMTQSRLKVVGGRAVLFEPTLVWPEGSE
jgi:hypothetical protein